VKKSKGGKLSTVRGKGKKKRKKKQQIPVELSVTQRITGGNVDQAKKTANKRKREQTMKKNKGREGKKERIRRKEEGESRRGEHKKR